MRTLRNQIGGDWVDSSASDCLEVTNPATAEPLARVPLSTRRDVDQAVAAARAAFPAWRAVPPVVRARHLFQLKQVLEQHFDDIAATITRENGKTLDEARGPVRRGIENVEHGGKEAVDALLAHPDVAGISFVGSSAVARHVYEEAAKHGKRVQALGGAKNHVVVLPDADLDRAVTSVSESLFGCAGQRCLAGSVVVTTGNAYAPFRDRLLGAAKNLRVGYGLDAGVTMGPVVSGRHKERVLSYVEAGRRDGAELLLDGRATRVERYPRGHFVGPTVFDGVRPEMTIGREEIFGPVASVTRVADLDEAIAVIEHSSYGNATSIFTSSGRAAREFRYRVGVSMIGVNLGVAAPMAFFPFGGTKGSFFGDLKAHGQDAIEFYTDKKVVMSRW